MPKPVPARAFAIVFADGSYFGRFAFSEIMAEDLRKLAEREARWRQNNLDCPEMERVPYHLGPLPCEVIPITITPTVGAFHTKQDGMTESQKEHRNFRPTPPNFQRPETPPPGPPPLPRYGRRS